MRVQYVLGNLSMDLEGDKALWTPILPEISVGGEKGNWV